MDHGKDRIMEMTEAMNGNRNGQYVGNSRTLMSYGF